ncbi:hypothetical protein [Amycolatopsis nigrescens]|uniref:hypothetical protein n=1 Tax=Amycolatopsis nigrescens TaxID=381445 RepID=UPI00039BF238|nr:hypothetical protein [Amycolatopsis nigrescens]
MAGERLGDTGSADGMMSGQQIFENFRDAPGTDGLQTSRALLEEVERLYSDRADQITSLAASMEEGWTGDAAGAAQRGAGPLAVEHGRAAQAMATAKDLLQNQTESFHDTRSRVVPVPPVPEAPSTWDKIVSFGSARSKYESKVDESNGAAQQNVTAMQGWTQTSGHNGSMMPSTYGDIDAGALNIGIAPVSGGPGPVDGGVADRGLPVTGGTPAAGPNVPQHSTGSPMGAIPAPPGTGTATSAPPGQSTNPGGHRVPTAPGTLGQGRAPEGQAPGLPEPVQVGGTGPVGRDSSSARTGTSIGPGTGGRIGSGSAAGRINGPRAGGQGPSPGSGGLGEKGAPGAGRGSGSGPPGEVARGGPAAAGARSAGNAGGTGAGGAPIGGAGRGRDDEDRRRKYVLEDDEPFQLTDEAGERVVDPRTGLSPTPPVIGQ